MEVEHLIKLYILICLINPKIILAFPRLPRVGPTILALHHSFRLKIPHFRISLNINKSPLPYNKTAPCFLSPAQSTQ